MGNWDRDRIRLQPDADGADALVRFFRRRAPTLAAAAAALATLVVAGMVVVESHGAGAKTWAGRGEPEGPAWRAQLLELDDRLRPGQLLYQSNETSPERADLHRPVDAPPRAQVIDPERPAPGSRGRFAGGSVRSSRASGPRSRPPRRARTRRTSRGSRDPAPPADVPLRSAPGRAPSAGPDPALAPASVPTGPTGCSRVDPRAPPVAPRRSGESPPRAEAAPATTVFDVGMFDGADTEYFLELGHRVVAVEAIPELVRRAEERFAEPIASGRLVCIHAAVTEAPGPVDLVICGDDPGSSSLYRERIEARRPLGSVAVPTITMRELLARHGVPHYLKVDIEGADRHCVLPLTPETRPCYLSFEIGRDVEALLAHAQSVGYSRFKIINQISFRELANDGCLRDRIAGRVMRWLGVAEPSRTRRAGRFFRCGRCSGPVPWMSDGEWRSGAATLSRWRAAAPAPGAWYDIHATVG